MDGTTKFVCGFTGVDFKCGSFFRRNLAVGVVWGTNVGVSLAPEQAFRNEFLAQYPNSPALFPGSYMGALRAAREQGKMLFTYIHCEPHQVKILTFVSVIFLPPSHFAGNGGIRIRYIMLGHPARLPECTHPV